MAKQKVRQMKVYGQSGYRYEETPTIMLKGKWLKELGFDVGDYVSINCEEGKLIITLNEERAILEKAEKDYLEKETRLLRKRFELEKEKIHQQFVAEYASGYVAEGQLKE